MALLLVLTLFAGATTPSDQALVYYNARMALREGRPTEALKLWLLRNAIESKTGKVSAHDADFRSVTWAALGQLGLCQDGFPDDAPGAGVWPLAVHNWVVRNMRRLPPAAGPSPFEAFTIGRQQRLVSVHDVLDSTELRAVRFRRTGCFGGTALLIGHGESWTAELSDKRVAARLLRHLLRRALGTLDPQRTVGRAALEARIFDINLRLAGLEAKARRRALRKEARQGRRGGLSKAEVTDHLATDPAVAIDPESEEGRILKRSLTWRPEEWMSLSSDRRQFIFAHATRSTGDTVALRRLKLAIIDRLIEAGEGAELQSWIAHFSASDDPATRTVLWRGARGRRILALDRDTGFRERAVIALHRGVDFLAAGRLPDALRSMAYALRWADASRGADKTRNLSRRWLSYVAAQFRVTDALLVMLKSVVPRAEFGLVLEDQLWHAALSADRASFDRCVRHQVGRGALNRRVDLLRPLAEGDVGAFATTIRGQLAESPYFVTRFLRRFLERLQAQDAEVRARHIPTLRHLKALLEEESDRAARTKRRRRATLALIEQMRAIVEGLTGVVDHLHEGDKAHGLSPDREVFAGSFRVAPSDPLPWPFKVTPVKAPRVFTPVSLRPEEWRRANDELVFGWRVGD